MLAVTSHQGEGVSSREADFAGTPTKFLLGPRDSAPEARVDGLGWESGGFLTLTSHYLVAAFLSGVVSRGEVRDGSVCGVWGSPRSA